jgi:opacity protein-like surface antigen
VIAFRIDWGAVYMKNTCIVLLAVLGVAFAGFAEAAKPRKRTRNANRIGAYGIGFIGQANYSSDVTEEEQGLLEALSQQGVPFQNLAASSETKDIGYQATFGYRFNRYFAAELGLVQVGEMSSTARGDLDFGGGFVPTSLSLSFSAGGPMVSAIGILPINDKFEVFGRLGYLFTSSEREIRSRVDGENLGFGSSKGDSQDVVYGAGASYHFNQVYSLRLEYQQLDGLGEEERSGTEDASIIGLGFVVRF